MEPTTHPATAHALGCGMNNGRPVIACICGLPNKSLGVPATLGAGEAANSPAFRAIKIPPMPDIHRLKMAVAESGLGRNEMDALESYAQSCARIAQEQADRAESAERTAKIQAEWAGTVEKENLAMVARLAAMPALQKAAQAVVDRLQMDIDDGSRPDQWTMKYLVDGCRAALAAWEGEK